MQNHIVKLLCSSFPHTSPSNKSKTGEKTPTTMPLVKMPLTEKNKEMYLRKEMNFDHLDNTTHTTTVNVADATTTIDHVHHHQFEQNSIVC